jgi:deoxycytidine triphosphate deaminase
LERLKNGEIFRQGTWDPDCINSTTYDLRMAEDEMVFSSPDGTFKRYDRGHPRYSEVILNPGDVAFISTRERICIPWDLAGSIGPKFSLTAQGVLVITGLFIEPGAGLYYNPELGWEAKQDERLHFLLVNVGPESVRLAPNTGRIAAIRFEEVTEPAEKRPVQGAEYEQLVQNIFDRATQSGSGAGLVFFRNMANVLSVVSNVKQLETRVEDLRQRLDKQDIRVSGIQSGSQQILVFGVFLVCVTILGVSIAAMFAIIANLRMNLSQGVALVIAAVILGVSLMAVSFFRAMRDTVFKEIAQLRSESAAVTVTAGGREPPAQASGGDPAKG